jgi:hypothetical protein
MFRKGIIPWLEEFYTAALARFLQIGGESYGSEKEDPEAEKAFRAINTKINNRLFTEIAQLSKQTNA